MIKQILFDSKVEVGVSEIDDGGMRYFGEGDKQFIRKLDLGKPFVLGCSWGGTLALNLAIKYPGNISKLILCSGVARNNIIKKPTYAKILEKVPWYPGKKTNEMFEKLMLESKPITKNELGTIKIPTLIFNGGEKDLVPKSEADYLVNNINNSKLIILERSGHCSYVIKNNIFMMPLEGF